MPCCGRYALAVVLIVMADSGTSLAQTSGVPDFNTLRTPTSPAFVLLGVEPSSVERPTSPSDFAASLVNATEKFSTLPEDFALEVSPYWLVGHPGQDWKADIRRNPWQSLQRTFTVSAATAQIGTEAAPTTGVGFSGRAMLFSGRLSDKTVKAIEQIALISAEEQGEFLKALLDAGLPAAQTLLRLAGPANDALADNSSITNGLTIVSSGQKSSTDKQAIADAQEAVARQLQRALDRRPADSATANTAAARLLKAVAGPASEPLPSTGKLRKALQAFVSAREGLLVEMAAGATWSAPNAVIGDAELGRWGTWLTVSYTLPEVSFVGVARYLDAGSVSTENDAVDLGARVVLTKESYAVSLEYVDRHLIDAEDIPRPWRLAGVFDYKVGSQLWLTGSFGRDYESESEGSLMARLGISVQFSKERYRSGP